MNYPNFSKQAREWCEYSAARAGYCTGEKFMQQVKASKGLRADLGSITIVIQLLTVKKCNC